MEIQHNKYSVFALERKIGQFGDSFTMTEGTFMLLETCNTLQEAFEAQKEYDIKTIILSSW